MVRALPPQVLQARVAAVAHDGAAINMKTYSMFNEKGEQIPVFQIDNIYVSNSRVARILSQINGVSDLRVRKLFAKWEEIHIWFRYRDRNFVVWEPYGDNSRYWLGPNDDRDANVDIKEIQAAFETYKPPFVVKILGDLVSLNFRSS